MRVLGEDGRVQQHQRQGWGEEELSPDSACCVGSTESQDQPQDGETALLMPNGTVAERAFHVTAVSGC